MGWFIAPCAVLPQLGLEPAGLQGRSQLISDRAAALRARHVAKGLEGLWDDRGRGIGPGEGALTRYCSHCAAFCLLLRRPPVRQLWPVAAPHSPCGCAAFADAAYKKFAMKGNKEHPLVSILVFVIGTLVGVRRPALRPVCSAGATSAARLTRAAATLRCAAQVVPLVVFAQKLMAPIPE
jgi:hypothetical protein